MNDIVFTIEITGWTSQINGSSLPICEIRSSPKIKNATMDFNAYSSETLVVHAKNEHYVSSFIFWSDARVHADIGDLHILLVNLEDKVGVVIYSKTVDFVALTVKGNESNVTDAVFADDKKGIWHGFTVLQNGEKLQVKVGDKQ